MQKLGISSHPETWVEPDKLGCNFPSYQPTYGFSGDFIDEQHLAYSTYPDGKGISEALGIKGWLRQADALKIYELAYFSEGDILELGSYNGLSTSIIAQAITNSKAKKLFTSVDLMFSHKIKTWINLWKRNLTGNVSLRQGDATKTCRNLTAKGKQFSFVFIDHSHTYEHCIGVCQSLEDLVIEGGFCLFHDFNDPRECDPKSSHGVSRAVFEGLNKSLFEFYGVYGCTALYRRKPSQA